jgi:hypothetical protein
LLTATALVAATRTAIDYNAAVESAEANILALSRSQVVLAETQRIANQAVADGIGGYEATLTALAGLIPLAQRYDANLQELLTVTQLLAAVDPAQGFEGAQVAIREALSGDFTSLIRRFEIPRAEIQRLKDEGVPNLEIIQRALADLGITTDLLAARSQTFSQRMVIALDTFKRFIADTGAPVFDTFSAALAGSIRLLNSPELKRGAAEYTDTLATGLNQIRHFAADPEVRLAFGRIAVGAGELFQALTKLSVRAWEPTLGALSALVITAGHVVNGLGLIHDRLERIIASDIAQGLIDQISTLNEFLALLNAVEVARHGAPVAMPAQALTEPPPGTFRESGRHGSERPPADIDIGGLGRSPARGAQGPDVAVDTRFAETLAASLAQARAVLRGFASDWDTELFDLFDELSPRVHAAFEEAFGNLSLAEQFAQGAGNLDTIAGRMVEDIQTIGRVSDETAAIVRTTLGVEAGNAVIALANEYAALAVAADKVKTATEGVESAQSALTAAQRVASDHAEAFRETIDGLQRGLSDLSQEADNVARAYADRLDALRDERDAAEEVAAAHRKSFQEQIDGLASVQAAKQQSELVGNLEADQRATVLGFEERIRAARNKRTPEGEKEARALEAERDQFLARSNYALDLERKRAAVAGDRADKESTAIEEQATAQAAKDQEAIDAIDDRIDGIEDEAATAARDYAARQRAIQGLIDEEEERARVVAAADKKAVDDATTRLTTAQEAKKVADGELTAQQNKVTAMERQDTLLGQQLGKWEKFIQYLQGLGIPLAEFFGGSWGGTPANPPPNPLPGTGFEALRAGPNYRAAPVPTFPSYVPPVPPPATAGGWAMANGGGGALDFSRRRGGGLTVNGPLVAVDTVRETAELGPLVDLAAQKAAELGARADILALTDDSDGGGEFSDWRR